MIYRLSVPATIENCDSVRILEWHRRPGQHVAPGDLVLEMETHKALIEVRAGQKGVLRQIACDEGDWCPLDGLLALFADDGDESLSPGAKEARPWVGDFTIG
jgi:pyruvate/2-oxoglutarate dehydrogenase complex dihydrolipoamide acyltransferase (E2) component